MTDGASEAVPVRPGEELPIAALRRFLADRLGIEGDPEVRQFPGGYSNLTYLVTAGGRELVLRRPPIGSGVRTAHDMGREFRVLSRLHPVFPKVPRPLAACDDPALLGAPFFVMERVPGVILRTSLPPGLALSPEISGRLAARFIDLLAELHGLDLGVSGLGELGRAAGYVERQVAGWSGRYQAAKSGELPDLERTFELLGKHLPPASGAALVHNDYKYDNLVLDPRDPAEIRAVLDWEMATVGDPLLDLGTALGYWVEASDPAELWQFKFGPTDLPGQPSRAELAVLYARRSGRDLSNLPLFYAFGLAKIAVIAQQIYARYQRGLTRDPRFAALPAAIRALGGAALAAVTREQL